MWRTIPRDLGTETIPMLINPDGAPTPEWTSPYQFQLIPQLTSREIEFYRHACRSASTRNHVVLDVQLSALCAGLILQMLHQAELVGLILFLPHELQIQTSNHNLEVASGLTTCLAVDPEHRGQGAAGQLIHKLMEYGKHRAIKTGYYFARQPHSRAGIPVKVWYRPLNISKCLEADCQITLPKHETFDDMPPELRKLAAEKFYKPCCSDRIASRPTKFKDLHRLQPRPVQVRWTKADWQRFCTGAIKWRTFEDVECSTMMVVGFRPQILYQPGSSTVINGCQLCFCETNVTLPAADFKPLIDACYQLCQDLGYIVMHGAGLGVLAFDGPYLGPLLATVTNTLFLDFYNLCVGRNFKASDFSLLYV
jgi:GNAT superfamily N-acetyltransferase